MLFRYPIHLFMSNTLITIVQLYSNILCLIKKHYLTGYCSSKLTQIILAFLIMNTIVRSRENIFTSFENYYNSGNKFIEDTAFK